jgi:asparagine synthase (glutamine-hydrolysing)
MCGIFGAIGRSLSQPAVERVLHMLEHRGPDGSGFFTDESAQLTLCHTRLAVIDVVAGEQPLYSDDGNIVLVANGEIYDFELIRNSLAAKGHRFSSHSDSEVIIALYREYGLGCFEHLRGEFAFLLYDRTKRLLLAARDRFGIKPLYLARLQRGFALASEMKAIFASGLVKPALNAAAFEPLSNHRSSVQFPFEGIEDVPPGSYLTVDLETFESRVTRYWSAEIPAETAQPLAEPDAAAPAAAKQVLDQLDEAVRLRLRADVPVGLYLSGGIDSAFIGALMSRRGDSRVHSFSIGFTGSRKSEQQQARETAQFLGTAHHELAVTREMLWANLKDSLWFSELPFVTLAPVGKFLLSEEAKKFVTVVLTGEGADEVFLGYRGYFQGALAETGRWAAKRAGASAGLRRMNISPSFVTDRLSLRVFHRSRRRTLAAARAGASATASDGKPLINALQEERIAAMPHDILCFLGDREEMGHSLEARLPFLDHRLYDAARRIPVDLKIRRGIEKAVLRDAAKGLLPEDLRLRRKTGFMMTSDAVDLFGADRRVARTLGRYLSKDAFERARVFSYGAYRLARLVARIPPATRGLKRLRQNSNKVIMYMLQAHMLQEMFVDDPRWVRPRTSRAVQPAEASDFALTA